MSTSRKVTDATELFNTVSSCQKCVRMSCSKRVLSFANGNLDAGILFVGEAPGRLGADDTAIPFHGDKAGDNFERLLAFAGISRYEAFVTNAVLCNPKDEKGNNATPTKSEVQNCATHLRSQVELIKPKIVATLGAVALRSMCELYNVDIELREKVGTPIKIGARFLVPLYHPGQRAMLHRSMSNQRMDYQRLAEILRRLGRKASEQSSSSPSTDILQIVRFILSKRPSVAYFDLHKIFFLAEYRHLQTYGSRMTRAYFMRQKDGPYCTDLHWKKLANENSGINVKKNSSVLQLELRERIDSMDFFEDNSRESFSLPDTVLKVVCNVLHDVGGLSSAKLKTKVYLTPEMREILKREKQGENQINRPLLRLN